MNKPRAGTTKMTYRGLTIVEVRKVDWDMLWHLVYLKKDKETWNRVTEAVALKVAGVKIPKKLNKKATERLVSALSMAVSELRKSERNDVLELFSAELEAVKRESK